MCLTLLGCGPARVRTNFAAELPASLTLRGFRDAPILEAAVEGIGPVAVVLDTGSTACVISPELAGQLEGPVRSTRRRIINAEGGEMSAWSEVTIGELDLGAVRFEGVGAIIADLTPLSRAYGEPILMIVGYPLFGQVPLTIDFARREVSIAPARRGAGEAVAVVDASLPIVRAEVSGVPIDVLIDSASSGGWALPIEHAEFEPGTSRVKRVLLVDGSTSVTDGRLNGAARIGGMVFDRPAAERTEGVPRVGSRALSSLRVTFDQRAGLVWFERVGEEREESARGIGAELRSTGQTWELWRVEPGLPAHALGLRDGEVVLAVDGIRVGELSQGELEERMQRAGRVRLDVMRAGGVEQIYVPVVSLGRP